MTVTMKRDRLLTRKCAEKVFRPARHLLTAGVGLAASAVAGRLFYARHTSQQVHSTAGRTVTTDDGVRLHVEIDGQVDGPLTIVLVHGFAARLQEFQAQRAALGGRGRLVLFDQRGHGSSGWGRFRAATIEQLGRDLEQVIAAQPPGPIVLVAHSMGGMAALSLAKERPEFFGERIVAVALLSTAAGHLPATTMPRAAARLAVRLRVTTVAAWLLWLAAPLIDRVEPFRRPWGEQWLLHRLFGGSNPSEEAAHIMRNTWIRTPLSIATAFYPALVSYNVPAALDVLQTMPVLVLAGTEDRAIPPERSKHLARAIGDSARLVLVEGAGHMVNLTHADDVNKALRELTDDLAVQQARIGDSLELQQASELDNRPAETATDRS